MSLFMWDVDDFLFGAVSRDLDRVRKHRISKCTFGTWVEKEGDLIVDKEKYIL